jgi:hypothetical protein
MKAMPQKKPEGHPEKDGEFEKFKDLTRRLVAVPKKEIEQKGKPRQRKKKRSIR